MIKHIEMPYRLSGHPEDPRFVADFSWCDQDPAAIRVTFADGSPESVVWIFGRELLADGITSLTSKGLGDVRIRRAVVMPGDPEAFTIHLNSPEGVADIVLASQPMLDWLAETERELPSALFEGSSEEKKIFGELDYAIEAILAKAEQDSEGQA